MKFAATSINLKKIYAFSVICVLFWDMGRKAEVFNEDIRNCENLAYENINNYFDKITKNANWTLDLSLTVLWNSTILFEEQSNIILRLTYNKKFFKKNNSLLKIDQIADKF